jgi:hypothetical protein
MREHLGYHVLDATTVGVNVVKVGSSGNTLPWATTPAPRKGVWRRSRRNVYGHTHTRDYITLCMAHTQIVRAFLIEIINPTRRAKKSL